MKYAFFTNSFKKNLRINNNYLILLASVLFFTTCTKKNVAPKSLESIATVKAKIEGTWQMIRVDIVCSDLNGKFLRNDKYVYLSDGRNWDFHPDGTIKMEVCGYDGINMAGVYSDTNWSLLSPNEIQIYQVKAGITTIDSKNFKFTTKSYKRSTSSGGCHEPEEQHIATYTFTK